jgi:glycosyltransferase involved in cell wall biosynthesis
VKALVSVVTPTFNRKHVLRRALDSIYAQTVPEVEAIVVDDGSSDGTEAMIAEYPRPVVYVQQENAGPAAARNRGLKRARGAFIAFLDSDDVFYPRHLEASLAALERSPQAGVVYGASEVVDADGRVVKVQRPRPEDRGRVLPRLLFYNFVMPSTVVMRRECYETVGGMNESLRFAEDWLYWLRLAERFPFEQVSEVLVRFQRSKISASRLPIEELVAMNREMLDIAFADPALAPAIAPYRRAAYAAMHRAYAETALELLDTGTARKLLARSLRQHPADARLYLLLAKALLPKWVLKNARGAMRGERGEKS